MGPAVSAIPSHGNRFVCYCRLLFGSQLCDYLVALSIQFRLKSTDHHFQPHNLVREIVVCFEDITSCKCFARCMRSREEGSALWFYNGLIRTVHGFMAYATARPARLTQRIRNFLGSGPIARNAARPHCSRCMLGMRRWHLSAEYCSQCSGADDGRTFRRCGRVSRDFLPFGRHRCRPRKQLPGL